MNELFSYLFDEKILKDKLRHKWIKLYDFNYIDNNIIEGLLKTKKNIADILQFVKNKATIGFAKESTQDTSSKPKTEAPENSKQEGEPAQPEIRRITVPEPFNLSVNKEIIFPPPVNYQIKFKSNPVPVEAYKKTSLKDINEKHQKQLEIIKKNVLEKYGKNTAFDLKTEKIKEKLPEIKKEIEKKEQESLQFNNKYFNPPKDFSKDKVDLKTNEAAIIREEYLITKKKKEEEAKLKQILIEKKDSKEFYRWQEEMKIKDDILKMQEIQKRKIELDLNREVASTYMQRRKGS